jgi:phage-related protein
MSNTSISIDFYQTSGGAAPVLDWLRGLSKDDRKIIGDDIRRIEEEWPLSAPVCKQVISRKGVWELRTRTTRLKSIRILFTIDEGSAVLLHSFIKKENKTPTQMFEIADRRLISYRNACMRRKARLKQLSRRK